MVCASEKIGENKELRRFISPFNVLVLPENRSAVNEDRSDRRGPSTTTDLNNNRTGQENSRNSDKVHNDKERLKDMSNYNENMVKRETHQEKWTAQTLTTRSLGGPAVHQCGWMSRRSG
jgi:hypothetical protein